MAYNMDFLIAGLVFLLIILYHFVEQRRLDLDNNRTFFCFLLFGMADLCFDLICSILIMRARPALAGVSEFCLVILDLLQVLVPYTLLRYIQTLLERPAASRRPGLERLWALPPALMGLIILGNHWSGVLFTVDEAGRYLRGPLYMGMYVFAGAYILLIAGNSMFCARRLGRREMRTIWELLFLGGGCVALQAVFHDLLLSGFGIALSITVLFFTLNNPYRYTDSLTGAFDVKYFRELVQSQVGKGKRFHLVTVELSQVKRVNRVLGAGFGNQLLIQTAHMLQAPGERSQVFRITGKRFLVMTESIAVYESVCRRSQRCFAGPVQINGEPVYSPAVLCGVIDAQTLRDGDALLAYVEYLTALAQRTPETILIQGDEETLKGFRYTQEIESFLETALEQDRFEVYYQPVYSLRKGGYVTLEALSRLRHPTLGPVAPEVFIGIAEKSDQIARLGLLQMRRVCRFLKEHRELMEQIQNVKINLSPTELMKSGHAGRLIGIIREFGLKPSYFQFEITETVATEYSESLSRAAAEFVEAGIGLCLDDFGAGYANLNTVLKLPFSEIKLDKSLLVGICEDDRIASFYQSIVAALQNMGYAVIAEGVETPKELGLVSRWGVDLIQGYYFSRPLPGEALLSAVLDREGAAPAMR